MTAEPTETWINGRWKLTLPEHRAVRPEWPTWEQERLASMHDLIADGDVVFDIGAEEGDLPALWATWGASVVLVEPNPRVWPNIRAVWSMNDLGRPLGWFVGFAGPTDDMDRPEWNLASADADGWPLCAYGDVIGDHGFLQLNERPDCPRVSIDTLTARHGPPDAITIDVEGSELSVLRGAHRTLTDHAPNVWVSIHPTFMRDQYGVDPGELHDWMADHGYVGEHLATDHEEHWWYSPR